MYHRDRKNEFIKAYTQDERNRQFCQTVFGKLWKFEDQLQCDIAQMSHDDVQRVLNQICGASESSVRNTLTILKAYARWSAAHGYPVAEHTFNVDVSAEDSVREYYVASPLHLERSLQYVFPDPNEVSIQYLCRAYLWLAFIGLQENEAVRVTESDLDFDSMTIRLTPSTWHTYPIYAEAVRDLHMASSMDALKSRVGRGSIQLERFPGAEILRTSAEGKNINGMILKTIRPAVSRAGKAARMRAEKNPQGSVGVCLTPTFTHIQQSGIFYRMYEEERLGITPNFTKYAEISLRAKMPEDGLKASVRRAQTARSDIRRRLEQEYARWKKVYVV